MSATSKTQQNLKAIHSCTKDLITLTILLSLLFGIFLGARPLSVPDEGRYTEIPREMVESGDFVTPRLNGVKYFEKPPLMYWLTAGSIKAFGINEWGLRFWPAFFAILGTLATYLFGQRFYGRSIGLASAGVLSTSLLYYAHSRILILDMPLAGIIACTVFSLFAAPFEENRWKKRLLMFVFFTGCAGAVLTKGLVGLAIPGCILVLWSLLHKRVDILKLAFNPLGILWFLSLVLPWHILAAHRNPEFFDFYIVHEQILRFLTPIHKRGQPFWFFVPIVLLGLFPWICFLPKVIQNTVTSFQKKTKTYEIDSALVLWIGFVFVFFSLSSSKLIPYMVPLFPPLAILFGKAVAEAWDAPSLSSVKTSITFYLILTGLLLTGLPVYMILEGYIANLDISINGILGLWSLTVGLIVILVLMRTEKVKAILKVMALSAVGLYLPLNKAWVYLEDRSIYPLAMQLKERLQPDDIVVTWHRYYQDLPPYIQHKTHVVEYPTEMAFGMSHEDVSSWMLSEKGFEELLKTNPRYYLVLRESALEELYTRYPQLKNLQIVMRSGRDILLTNK